MNRKALIDEGGEVRKLTSDDIQLFKPTPEVVPSEFLAALPKRGKPRKSQPKISTTIRLDAEVLEYFRAS